MRSKDKTKSITVHISEKMEHRLRREAEMAHMTLSRYCGLLMEAEKGELLLERQKLMTTIFELRVKIATLQEVR